ncbi:MAG: hypothetical protein RL091_474, partial [Verrucomicrobiota bacterium]
SNLLIELIPRVKGVKPVVTWSQSRTADNATDFNSTLTGPPPWQLKVPLVAGRRNAIHFSITDYPGLREDLQFSVRSLRIEDGP